jgi:hypothetical protein
LSYVAFGHADGLEGDFELVESEGVVITTDLLAGSSGSTMTKVAISCLIMKMEMLALLRGSASNQVVENMKIAFARGDGRDTVTLQVIVKCFDAAESSTVGELELSVFSEAGSIGVKEGAGVAKGFDDEFGSGNLGSQFGALFSGVANA